MRGDAFGGFDDAGGADKVVSRDSRWLIEFSMMTKSAGGIHNAAMMSSPRELALER